MATRKLYREIAESIRTSLVGLTPEQADGAALHARSLAAGLKADNSKFRYDTFFEACGLDSYGYPVKKVRS